MRPEIGSNVVVPSLSVGRVEAHEPMTIEGRRQTFCRISFGDGKLTWIPMNRLGEAGVRPVMKPKAAQSALQTISEQTCPEKRANWNRRQRRYRQLIQDNLPHTIATLVGELGAVRSEKGNLSFGERVMFEKARDLLAREIAVAMGIPTETADARICAALPS